MPDYDQLAYNLRKPLAAYFQSYAALLDLGRGTALPTVGHDGAAVQAGARFFRTDLGFLCYYNGTRWLTVQEYSAVYTGWSILPGAGTNANAVISAIPTHTDYTMYATRVSLKCLSTVAGNATNYHRVWINLDGAGFPSVYGTTLDTIAANVWTDKSGTPTPVWSGSPQYSECKIEKVNAPTGTVYVHAAARYRLIIP